MKWCVYIWTFHELSIKIIFSEIATYSPTHWVRLLNLSSVHFWTFTVFSDIIMTKNVLVDWALISKLEGNLYHSLESHFSIALNRVSNSCVLEIIFGGFLQISRVTICQLRHFLSFTKWSVKALSIVHEYETLLLPKINILYY